MEFERSVLKVKVYGKEHSLKKPTVKQIEELQSAMQGIVEEKEQFAITKKWVSELGLPEKSIDEMELEHFVLLLESLSGSKKK